MVKVYSVTELSTIKNGLKSGALKGTGYTINDVDIKPRKDYLFDCYDNTGKIGDTLAYVARAIISFEGKSTEIIGPVSFGVKTTTEVSIRILARGIKKGSSMFLTRQLG